MSIQPSVAAPGYKGDAGRGSTVTRVRGVDARGRAPFWLADLEHGQVHDVRAVEELDQALAAPEAVDVVTVDVALGHEDPEGHGAGLRACDAAARELLGEARDRYFVLPPPAVFQADTYHDALAACEEHGWPKLEAPLWFARGRLQALAERAGEDPRLHEVHPEVSFAHMRETDPRPAERYGDTWAALHERLERLHGRGLHPEGYLEDLADPDPRAALDACAAAWSAQRVQAGRARRLPADPPSDPRTGRAVALQA